MAVVVIAAFMLQLREDKTGVKQLEKLLPVYKVENGCVLSKNGDVTVVFRLELPEIFTLSNDEYETLHHNWVRAVKVLPPHTVVHKQDWFTKVNYQADFNNPDQSFLAGCSERFFHERPFLDHQCYLMITRRAVNRKPASSVFSNLLRTSFVPPDSISPVFLEEFLNKVGQFEKLLGDSGFIKVRRLREDEITGTAQSTGLLERYCFLLHEQQKPIIKDIVFKPEWKIGEQYCQLYAMSDVEDLPALCGPRITYDKYSTDKTKFSVGFAAPVGQLLSCNHIYNQYLFVDDAQKTLKRMESKRRRLQSLAAYSRENAISRDATNAFLNEAIGQQRLPVKAHFNLLVWTDKREELNELRNKASAALAQMDAVPRQEVKGAPQIYWAGLPGNSADFPGNDTFDTFAEQAVCFFNQETNYRSSVSPIGIRLGERITGKPVLVDISDEPMQKGIITNRNKMILGPSGSGKSFFTNLMVRSYYEQGTHIVLIDVGHSYKGLCTLVNGYYFTYEEKNPIRFNPFYLTTGDALDTEKKESIKTLLLALWKKDNEEFKRSEYVALSNALTAYYEYLDKNNSVFPCFNTFYEYLQEYYMAILKTDGVKDKDFDADNFMYVLRPYYRGGEFDYLLNSTENLDVLNERLVIFELDNVKDHPILFPVVTLIIMEVFISKMRKLKGVRKMILIEEAWKAIAKEGMAEYIKYLFKTVRKFFGEAIVVTQDVEDIISSPVIKQAIVNNSDCKILLDQSKYQNKFGLIQELLGLTEKEKALILSMNKSNEPGRKYKEVFISLAGVLSKVYRTEVSPEEYLTYTTEEREKVKVAEYAKRFGSMQKGIKALVAELHNP